MRYNNPQKMVVTGQPTPQTVIYKSESHKLHQAFPVKANEVILQGNPVKLEANGTISNYFGTGLYLGIAVTDSVYPAYPPQEQGYEVTVMIEGFAIVYGLSGEAFTSAGAVLPNKQDEDSQYVTYMLDDEEASTTKANPKFIALNKTTAVDELVQILIR